MIECDMIVNLNRLPEMPVLSDGISIRRGFAGNKEQILSFVAEHFSKGWVGETEKALWNNTCFIAVQDGKVVGVANFDTSAKGFFGPIGVHPDLRGKKVGAALLIRTLRCMYETGYGYAIIGWVGDAAKFYEKLVGATFIPGGEPENSVYMNMVQMD